MNDTHIKDEIKIIDGRVHVRTYYERVFEVSEIDKMLESSARWVQTLLKAKGLASEQCQSS